MQKIQDLQDKIFFEVKNILESLSKLENTDELLRKTELFRDLEERVYFLKVLDKNISAFEVEEVEDSTNDVVFNELDETNIAEVPSLEEEAIEEEVIFNNELNEIGVEDNEVETDNEFSNGQEVVLEVEGTKEVEPLFEAHGEAEPELVHEEQVVEEEIISESEVEQPTVAEETLVVENEETKVEEPHQAESTEEEERREERKFKLAHIRNLKSEPTLFDQEIVETPHEPSSFMKTNISTDYMEAKREIPEFRLDINDRIAFSKTLFKGSQDELNQVIRELNTFKTLDEAKEYLSEMYYEKKWDKVDEYAQRLWALVESKFL